MYQLQEVSFGEDKEKTDLVEQGVAEKLMSNFKYLGNNMKSYYYYQIAKRNLKEIILFIDNQQNKFIDIDLVECNRLLFNYIDTLYAFVNYFEINYKKQFEIVKREVYDSYFEYRFTYNLRNFMIHEDLGILSVTKQVYKDKILVKFNIDTNNILNSTRIQKHVREEIKNTYQEKNVDIYPILHKQFEIIKVIQEKMLIALSEELLLRFDYISQKIINQNETFLVKDEKIINGLLNVASKFYSTIAENFIYEENYIESDNDITKFFMRLSYSYYKEPNVIYESNKLKKTP